MPDTGERRRVSVLLRFNSVWAMVTDCIGAFNAGWNPTEGPVAGMVPDWSAGFRPIGFRPAAVSTIALLIEN